MCQCLRCCFVRNHFSIMVGEMNADLNLVHPAILTWFVYVQTTREIVTLERMHQAFDSGLMRYGMMKAVKS